MKSFEKKLIMSIRFSFNVFPLEQYQHERKFEARIDFFFRYIFSYDDISRSILSRNLNIRRFSSCFIIHKFKSIVDSVLYSHN